MTIVVGVDIAKHTFDIATLQPNGKHRTKSKLSNDAEGFAVFAGWLKLYAEPGAWIVMEATGIYHEALAEHCYRLGYRVAVLNPAQIKSYAQSQLQRSKTDKLDSKLIATYGHLHREGLRPWQPEPLNIRQLRALTRRLDDLKELRQMEFNRLDVSRDNVHDSINAVLQRLDEQIAETQRLIKQHIDDDPDLRSKRDLLVTINGVADKTATLLIAELGDHARFTSARAVVAFAGLDPRLQESGKHQGHVRISRMGSARIRAGLYMPAVSTLTHNPAIKALAERMEAKGKKGKQIVCAAMRKLLNIAYGVLKSGVPFDAKLALAR
ncbi:IS110 family transposase [Pseudomonas matsuisoli]|uniref:IS110 family transposase n=1 Tax=Pseudomonas matsuisoli TaxID=1515666 RepID=A0A917V1V2_9PSED|nr:IS110 family transposase [Pseudomonas matsuisoli]GGK10777.1 IS110 family transposase [Pseudomonas matsuisoli]